MVLGINPRASHWLTGWRHFQRKKQFPLFYPLLPFIPPLHKIPPQKSSFNIASVKYGSVLFCCFLCFYVFAMPKCPCWSSWCQKVEPLVGGRIMRVKPSLLNGVSTFIKEADVRTQLAGDTCESDSRSASQSASTVTLDCPAPRTMRGKLLVLIRYSVIVFC